MPGVQIGELRNDGCCPSGCLTGNPRVAPERPEKAEQHNAAQRRLLNGWFGNALSDASMECEAEDIELPLPRTPVSGE